MTKSVLNWCFLFFFTVFCVIVIFACCFVTECNQIAANNFTYSYFKGALYYYFFFLKNLAEMILQMRRGEMWVFVLKLWILPCHQSGSCPDGRSVCPSSAPGCAAQSSSSSSPTPFSSSPPPSTNYI